ncbi:helix-turn-helix domain-containing protein, partial [Armatimonas sp.]|uniref:helix-turn-helix domain-containing protein n=1 Tax=Armatimonas sp. TaxID=1872638 RepID=UPI00286C9CFD
SGFTQVPNAILRTAKLSPAAKLTYAMLLSYAWQNDFCFPGQERLASDIGVTDRSVRTYLKELETKGLLSIKQQGQGRPNVYHLDLQAELLITGKASKPDRNSFLVKTGKKRQF